ncbi:MAG TPA: HipA family kinase [Longimicrobiales bacterium]|nr:HipA family kinase [Longimicrobiales bacterium]
MTTHLPRLDASIYLAPLREGGSLPAVVETVEGGLWVVKFRGAGQGPRALVAEIIVAGLARAVGLPVPELSLVILDAGFGQGERDPEIRDVLKFSEGVNVGIRYLDGAFNLDPVAVPEAVEREIATATVWLDALVTNPDRSPRNPNMMLWSGRLWLIDHGAALFDHHDWSRVTPERIRRPFAAIKDHVLLPMAGDIGEADARLAARLDAETLAVVVEAVPDELLVDATRPGVPAPDAAAERTRYVDYLRARLETPRAFALEAERVRRERVAQPPHRLEARR